MSARWVTYASTGNIFDGIELQNTWARENEAWNIFTSRFQYDFPHLNNSAYGQEPKASLPKPNICQDIYWAADGTSIVTTNSDYGIRQYLIPDNSDDENKILVPYTRKFYRRSIITSRIHPEYSLFNENEFYNCVLFSSRDLPLQLYNFKKDTIAMSYDIMNEYNEIYEPVYSIEFTDNEHFLVGSVRNKVAFYDITRKTPVWKFQTSKRAGRSTISKAIVSALTPSTIETNQLCYFGTYKNEIFAFDIRTSQAHKMWHSSEGNGIYQLLKSGNGHFMYVLKRNSDLIDVLDLRQNLARVNTFRLSSRVGSQKFKACIDSVHGLIIGGYDGHLEIWSRDAVEFGGILNQKVSDNTSVRPELKVVTEFAGSRLNIVQNNPVDPNMTAISYSPNRFVATHGEKSGVALLEQAS